MLITKRQFSGWSKLEAFADDKINVTNNMEFVVVRVENIVDKGENADNQTTIFQTSPNWKHLQTTK